MRVVRQEPLFAQNKQMFYMKPKILLDFVTSLISSRRSITPQRKERVNFTTKLQTKISQHILKFYDQLVVENPTRKI